MKHPMKRSLTALCVCLFVTSVQIVGAQEQDPAHYREFRMGSNLATIAGLIGKAPSEAELIHQRPAVMQDLEWRPRYFVRAVSPKTDPVETMRFRFYDDQLFAVIVDYDRDRTAGMTDADMVEGVTAEYGPPSKLLPPSNRAAPKYGGPDVTIAIWGDKDFSVTLMRMAYPVSFRLVVASPRLDTLARTAAAESVRLDAMEAPQREIAREKKESDAANSALEKAKAANKAVFRP